MSSRNEKTIRADFFTIDTENCVFDTVLKAVDKRGGKDRNFTISSGDPIRLKILKEVSAGDRTMLVGDMAKIRMTNLPTRIGQNGSEREIDFLDDEGVGEETAFLYDPKRKALALQRNRHGVSYAAFAEYFTSFAGESACIRLLPMISQEALKKLQKSPRVTRIEIEVQPVTSLASLRGSRSLAATVGLMEHLAGEKVAISVGLSRGSRGGLSIPSILETVKETLRFHSRSPCEIRRLRVQAEDEERRIAELDLLEDRLRAHNTIPYDESRRISLAARIDFLVEQWLLLDSRLTSKRPSDGPAS